MEIADVARFLPQRPPILMIERVTDLDAGRSGVGHRTFRDGDACFDGHFPGRPILPGVLIIEALAQTAHVVLMAGAADLAEAGPDLPLGYLARVHEMSFQRPIEPGQDIRFEVRVEEELGSFTKLAGRVLRGTELCAKGRLAIFLDRQELAAALERRRAGTRKP